MFKKTPRNLANESIIARNPQIVSIKKSVKKLKAAARVERRMLNNNSTVAALPAAGSITYLSTIAQGDDNPDRSGNGVKLTEFRFWLNLNFPAAQNTLARYIILQDTMNQAALPLVLDVLQLATVDSQYNIPSMMQSRFKILYDQTFNSDTTHLLTQKKKVIKGSRFNTVNFAGVAAVVGSAGKGALFLLRIVNNAAAATADSFSWTLKFDP